ncbi:MAG: hypothetical protein H6642_15545 [Caldilineaceae bacterium]|nr:hypothetical protein [Caldilineaceae bacterium]MCB9139756.1 hypothetical protein [Caldilineaceae bacterium]
MTEEMLWGVLTVVMLILVYAYGFEYFRYKTVKPKFKRRFNYLLFGWMSLIVIIAMTRNLLLGILGLFIVAAGYAFDQYIVDKMPGNN